MDTISGLNHCSCFAFNVENVKNVKNKMKNFYFEEKYRFNKKGKMNFLKKKNIHYYKALMRNEYFSW